MKIIGIINWNTVVRDQKEWTKAVLEAKFHRGRSVCGCGVYYTSYSKIVDTINFRLVTLDFAYKT